MTKLADLESTASRVAARLSAGRGSLDPTTAATEAAFVARAPGRLDVMGGIADYSGSLVLQWPIRESTRVAVQRRADRVLYIESSDPSGTHIARVPVDLFEAGRASSYWCWRRSPMGHGTHFPTSGSEFGASAFGSR